MCLFVPVGCAQLGKRDSQLQPHRVVNQEHAATPAAGVAIERPNGQPPIVSTVGYQLDEVGNEVDAKPNSASGKVTPSDESAPPNFEPVLVQPIPDEAYAYDNSVVLGEPFSSAAGSYTLADIEQIAMGNNPAIAAANATVNKAAGLRQQVGVRPNPTLGYFGFQIADRGTDQHGAFIEQEFVRGNKLALNREVLQHTTTAQRWEIETQRYRVLTDVRVRFFEALAAQRQVDAINGFADVARRGVQVAKDRKDAKEGNDIDILQSQTLLSEVSLAAERAEVAYRGAWNDLSAIAGLTDTTPARLVADFSPTSASPNWDVAYAEIVSQSPEMSVARALVCEKQAMLRRQQVQMVPNVTGQLGVGYDDATNSGLLNLQVGAPIPVWNKNSGNVSAAYADYTRAVENVKRIEQSIKARLARAAQEYEASLASVKKYEQEIIPQTKKGLELSEQAYKVGELAFLQILVVRRSYYEATVQLIAAQGQLAQASAKVDGLLLTGGLDAPVDYTAGDGVRGQTFSGQ
jgi:cobalt-zinc-cadmium efflux system outer membrane protein